MFKILDNLETALQPLTVQSEILEAAYELYLQAPQSDYPTIDLRKLARETGTSLWDCRNVIVSANKVGKFPNCALSS